MADVAAEKAKVQEPIQTTAGVIASGIVQAMRDLNSLTLDLQRFAAAERADLDAAALCDKLTVLQSIAAALRAHALRFQEIADPVRSVLQPEPFYQAGLVALRGEQYEKAAQFFRRALELRAEYPEAYQGLGDVLRKQGAHEDAIEQYRRAADAHARLAHSLEADSKITEAAQKLCNAGAVFMELNCYDEAADVFHKAIRLDHCNAQAYTHLASALFRKEEYEAAEAALRTSIELDSTSVTAYWDLARVLMHLDRQDEAARLLSKSATISLDQGTDLGDEIQVPAYRIKHDRDQVDLLTQRGLLDQKWEAYADYLNTLWQDPRTRADSGAPILIVGNDVQKIAPSFNRIVYLSEAPAIPGGALRANLDAEAIQYDYAHTNPEIVWIDNFLTDEALLSLRRFCSEATMWKRNYPGGYVGTLLSEGFSSPLTLQIAEEIRTRLPAIFGSHRLEQAWAFKYDSTMRGVNIHADFAAVNVNFWITPDEACLDPDNSGLVIWNKGPPKDSKFFEYNAPGNSKQMRRFLADAGAHSIRIPYRSNRCIIFNSTLFHETDRFMFVDAYEHRRINITFLYGIGLPPT
jgi:tetratricopeptide (TPR) repeat protein